MAKKVWRGREAALWLAAESLTLEHGGEPLSRYEARLALDTGNCTSLPGRGCSDRPAPARNFAFRARRGWLKVLKLEGYSHRPPRHPQAL
ncbi:MAG: hypothetical protein H0U02_11800 [Rubrobacter sp.]|jgi:hypothetical protein|nr:hypothetical protein [Rubrobacter sp.]